MKMTIWRLQESLERLGRPPGREALLRGGPARVPRSAVRPSARSLRSVREQEEQECHQAVSLEFSFSENLRESLPAKVDTFQSRKMIERKHCIDLWKKIMGLREFVMKVLQDFSKFSQSASNPKLLKSWKKPFGFLNDVNFQLRSPCVHHGELRGADARVPELHQGRCGLGRSASEHLERDAAAVQDPQGHPQEPRQEVPRAARRDRRGQGQLQEVLRTVRKEHQGEEIRI